MKFCPECGAKQEENEEDKEVKEVEIVGDIPETEDSENKETEKVENNENEDKTNLEKTTEVEVNPDAQDISEEEMNKIGEQNR